MLIHLYFESSGSNVIKRNLRTLPPQNHNTTTQERRPRDRFKQHTQTRPYFAKRLPRPFGILERLTSAIRRAAAAGREQRWAGGDCCSADGTGGYPRTRQLDGSDNSSSGAAPRRRPDSTRLHDDSDAK
ncbi:hypothetical protein AAHA92_17134 [Salvia divinorum]|uniref:Uncharacterized protein n=1 Tax=Salvia divinorum TaxID=28513 RepID=A0ABD1H0X5_SALDI